MKQRIMIVGLGYVGIQLAYAFSQCDEYDVVGFDVNAHKIMQYQNGDDMTNEIGAALIDAKIKWCSNIQAVESCDVYIVTVSTPTRGGVPIYEYVDTATKMVAKHMKKGSLIIYESTYPPYTTETRCVPLLERHSHLHAFRDFKFAYSPERINPGDNMHTLSAVTKLVAGGDEIALQEATRLYRRIITNVKTVTSIPIAEAAKIVENSQRDVNIALLNQFAMLYPDIEMHRMIDAMNTKWNALGFHNGLVGGHCVAEDPYYLIDQQLKQERDFSLLTEARKINEAYVEYILKRIIQVVSKDEDILFFGLTFKPNTPDIRNSKALEIYLDLQQKGYRVFAVDPFEVQIHSELNNQQPVVFADEEQLYTASTHIYSVAHDQFQNDQFIANKEVTKVIDLASVFHAYAFQNSVDYFRFH